MDAKTPPKGGQLGFAFTTTKSSPKQNFTIVRKMCLDIDPSLNHGWRWVLELAVLT
jgi:hypothetical protein